MPPNTGPSTLSIFEEVAKMTMSERSGAPVHVPSTLCGGGGEDGTATDEAMVPVKFDADDYGTVGGGGAETIVPVKLDGDDDDTSPSPKCLSELEVHAADDRQRRRRGEKGVVVVAAVGEQQQQQQEEEQEEEEGVEAEMLEYSVHCQSTHLAEYATHLRRVSSKGSMKDLLLAGQAGGGGSSRSLDAFRETNGEGSDVDAADTNVDADASVVVVEEERSETTKKIGERQRQQNDGNNNNHDESNGSLDLLGAGREGEGDGAGAKSDGKLSKESSMDFSAVAAGRHDSVTASAGSHNNDSTRGYSMALSQAFLCEELERSVHRSVHRDRERHSVHRDDNDDDEQPSSAHDLERSVHHSTSTHRDRDRRDEKASAHDDSQRGVAALETIPASRDSDDEEEGASSRGERARLAKQQQQQQQQPPSEDSYTWPTPPPGERPTALGRCVVRHCEEQVSTFIQTSRLISEHLMAEERDCMAPFDLSEIDVGDYLGRGEFSNVFEITGFRRDDEGDSFRRRDDDEGSSQTKTNNDTTSWDVEEDESRRFLAENSLRRKDGESSTTYRYALKFLRPDLLPDEEKFVTAARDLAVEAQFLSAIEHPHIMKLRGWAASGTGGYITGSNEGYFLIMDRLVETLEDRMKRWAKERRAFRERARRSVSQHMGSVRNLMGAPRRTSRGQQQENGGADVKKSGGAKKQPPPGGDSDLAERLKVGYDIAGAMEYLHERNIIYRDLKPANLGFDIRGDVKLFDFGLAKELPHDRDMNEDRMRMSMAGSMRYMSPEMLKFEPYNLKADVYTFSVVLYEILSLKRAYQEYKSRDAFFAGVVCESRRPRMSSRKCPEPVKEIMEMCWDTDVDDRPTMELARNVLRFQCMYMRGDERGLDHNKRRSMGSIGCATRSSLVQRHDARSCSDSTGNGWKSDSQIPEQSTVEWDGQATGAQGGQRRFGKYNEGRRDSDESSEY